jgi:hypothetical protein
MLKHSTLVRNVFLLGLIISLMSPIYLFSKNNINLDKRSNSDDDQKKLIEKKATDLASDLQSRMHFTNIQASEVKTILINYFTNVSIIQFTQRAGAREKTYDVKSDPPSDLQDLNLNYDDNSLEDLRNADNEANSKLNSIISTSQISKWNDVKDSWWSKVIAVQYEDE